MICTHDCRPTIYLLGVFVWLSSQACHRNYAAYTEKSEKQSYIANQYHLPLYTLEELKTFLGVASSKKIDKLREALKKNKKKWLATSAQEQPEALWQAYKQSILHPLLDDSALTKLSPYFQCWEDFLKDPTVETQNKLQEAVKIHQSSIQQLNQKLIKKLYYAPESWSFSKAQLAYEDFLSFVLERPFWSMRLKLDVTRTHLQQWQKDHAISGSALWEKFTQTYAQKLENYSHYFQYAENQAAVAKSLQILDQFVSNEPYCLNYKEWTETIPHGLDKLGAILEDAGEVGINKKDHTIDWLKLYQNIVKDHLI